MKRLIPLSLLLPFLIPATAPQATDFQPGYRIISTSEKIFDRAHDVALSPDGFFLFVADLGNNEIKILEPGTLKLWSAFGREDGLGSPRDVVFLTNTRIAVADTDNSRIVIYDFNGIDQQNKPRIEKVAEWTDGMSRPEGLAADRRNSFVYVANVGTSSIAKVDFEGKLIKQVGAQGDAPLEFSGPHDIAIGPDRNLYIADSWNSRVQVLSLDLEYVRELSPPDYDLEDPKYMAFSEAGGLYLTDKEGGNILVMDADFKVTSVIGTGTNGDGPGELNRPEGVDVALPFVWISDTYNSRVLLLKQE